MTRWATLRATSRCAKQARIFQRAVRSYDWVGRYGGEEFLLILPGSDYEAARAARSICEPRVEAAVSARATRPSL